jgi:cysteinyl-tRNA synthetase
MDDDLGTPAAVAVIHDQVREGNSHLAEGRAADAAISLALVRGGLDVLGLDPLDPMWAGGGDEKLADVTAGLVQVALDQRDAARARKDYAAADAIRDSLAALGVQVEDTPQGPRWELAR